MRPCRPGRAHALERVDAEQVAGGDAQQLEALRPGQGAGVGGVDGARGVEGVEDVEGGRVGQCTAGPGSCWPPPRRRGAGQRGWARASTRTVAELGVLLERPAQGDDDAVGCGRAFGGAGQRLGQDALAATQGSMPGGRCAIVAACQVGAGGAGRISAVARLRVALCQLDTVVGDIDGNVERILGCLARAEADGADLAAFPELAITGYPPEDLLLKPAFVADNLPPSTGWPRPPPAAWPWSGSWTSSGTTDVSDAVARADGAGVVAREAAIRGAPAGLRNALAVCAGGDVVGVYHKRLLPNYGVFDEERWFAPGTADLELYEIAGVRVGVTVCEDLWFADGPVAAQAAGGARLIVNVNASPYLDRPRSRPPGRGPASGWPRPAAPSPT